MIIRSKNGYQYYTLNLTSLKLNFSNDFLIDETNLEIKLKTKLLRLLS